MSKLEGNHKVNPDKLTYDGKPVKGWIVERIDAAGNVVRKWLELFMPNLDKLPDDHRARPLTYADDPGITQAKEALARPVAKPPVQAPAAPPRASDTAPNTNPPAPAVRPPVPSVPQKAMAITPAPTPVETPAPIGAVGALYLEVSTMEAAKKKTVPISLIRERLNGCTDAKALALLDTVAAVARLGYKELDLGSVLRALK